MQVIISSLTVKAPTDKASGITVKLVGSMTENVLPPGKDSATDPVRNGVLTINERGTGFTCKMRARYKLVDGGRATEVTWTIKPDDVLSSDTIGFLLVGAGLGTLISAQFSEGR